MGRLMEIGQAQADRLARKIASHDRWSPQTKVTQAAIKNQWMASTLSPFPLETCGFRVFSQFEEDGLLLAIFSLLGDGNRTFLDLGSADGVNSNCANLAINHGWRGAFVDANKKLVANGKRFYEKHPDTWAHPPIFVCGYINRESVNSLVAETRLPSNIDLLSVDLDGNDYWVWHALEQVQPRVVITEIQAHLGMHNIVVPYDSDYRYPGNLPHYHGASLVAMEAMAKQKGYRLVGANFYGFNAIWIRDPEGEQVLPSVSPGWAMRHPRNVEVHRAFGTISSLPFIEGGTGFPGTPAELDQ